MRSVIVVIITLVVVIGGFVGYVLFQSPTPTRIGVNLNAVPVTAPPPIASNDQQVGEGAGVWTKSYDSKTGNLSNEFRAVNYKPNSDGTVDITEPQAYFYLGGGQKLYIQGKTGNVVDPNATKGKVQGQSQAPDRGTLRDVTLKLFNKAADAEPQFTCTMNNLAFDNDTFRITTEDCDMADASGKTTHVLADQVPVHIVGIDYDFDGRGLLIKWNERDRRLSRMEIAHGEQLIVKHPNALNLTTPSSQPISSTAAPSPGSLEELGEKVGEKVGGEGDSASQKFIAIRNHPHPDPLPDYREREPEALASADPAAAGDAIAPPPKRKKRKPTSKPVPPPTSGPVIHRSKDPGIYRATFHDDVRITQSGLTLATADRMNVDFIMTNGPSTQPSTEPTTQTTAEPGVLTAAPIAATVPTTRRSQQRAKSDRAPARKPAFQTGAQSTTQPATQPAAPIVVKWTGKLVVAPPTPDVAPVELGDSVLELVGDQKPAILNRDGSVITCGSFRYHTLDQSVDVNSAPVCDPIVLDDASNGSHIKAPSMHYDGTNESADLIGPATARFRADSGATKASTQPEAFANVDWSENCHLTFTHDIRGERVIDRALLEGDVKVDHPQVRLTADALDLGFDNVPRATTMPSTNPSLASTSAQLRSLDADGEVDCILVDSANKKQHIQSDTLKVRTERGPQGASVPTQLVADGTVHAFDDTQHLDAGHLVADLEPSTDAKPANGPNQNVQLKQMHAQDDVHFWTADGAFANADQLDVQTVKDVAGQGVQIINLTGNASAGDKQNTITGPIITYNPATKEAHVVGPGTMHTVQQSQSHATTQSTPRPMDIGWHGKFDLVDDIVTITNTVIAKSTSADGTTNNAVGDKIVLNLIDAPPTTQPSTQSASQPAATQPPATQPAATRPALFARGTDTNFMKNKVVDTVTLTALPDQNVEVNSILLAPAGGILRAMNLIAPVVIYDKTNEQFRVPTAGRLLVRDNRTDKPAATPATPVNASTQPLTGAGGMHGATAFEWKKDLVYSEKQNQAVMTGDVHIVHEAPGAAAYEIYTDRVIADIEPVSAAAATDPKKTDAQQSFRVKKLSAIGMVRMVSSKVNFDAAECVYDPATQVITAHSNAREPAHVLDATGLSTGSFDELIYNTQSGDVHMKEFHAFVRKH